MKFLKWLFALLIAFGLGAFGGYKVGSGVTLVDEFQKSSKQTIFLEQGRLAQSGNRAFVAYTTNKNDAITYLLSEHAEDLEKTLRNFPPNTPKDEVVVLLGRRDLVGALVLTYGRLAMLKGDKDGEQYRQKALALSVNWSSKVVDKKSLNEYVKTKDAAGDFW